MDDKAIQAYLVTEGCNWIFNAMVNARPLVPVPSDPEMPEILTPATSFANTEVQSLEVHALEFQQHKTVQQAVEAGPVLGQHVLDPLAKRIPADTTAKKEVAKRN